MMQKFQHPTTKAAATLCVEYIIICIFFSEESQVTKPMTLKVYMIPNAKISKKKDEKQQQKRITKISNKKHKNEKK